MAPLRSRLQSSLHAIADDGFTVAVLIVVVVAVVLAFGFGAGAEIVASVLILGLTTAFAEGVLRAKK
ncbi:hypothetical protein [Bradyrhizobium prioriisuperbiae]|uniref:hypothetical protein n=1 Tax=Bradyrhizobium prioriisuperbiae TaxID=2854389 RepID=UPI0028E1D556|nr:hypothetical protein [Bradyrhizobium prioritasuperba]